MRLENMCWRIWNLARQKKQLEGEEAKRIAKRRLERDRGRREAIADMSEDLSKGEKGDTVSDSHPNLNDSKVLNFFLDSKNLFLIKFASSFHSTSDFHNFHDFKKIF